MNAVDVCFPPATKLGRPIRVRFGRLHAGARALRAAPAFEPIQPWAAHRLMFN